MQDRIQKQLERFKKGFPFAKLERPATVRDGITRLSKDQEGFYESIYESSVSTVEKFVPASGAATRMFKNLIEMQKGIPNDLANKVILESTKLPFGLSSNSEDVLKEILEARKLQNQPKALLPFHEYSEDIRTSAEEHLFEGIAYASKAGVTKIHFTVSAEHQEQIASMLEKRASRLEGNFEITYSIQESATDTVAVDVNNAPIKGTDGNPVFRPAGHGALLSNLNQRDADVIFIKNIDNVVPDRLKTETIRFKKIMAGILLDYQSRAFDLLSRMDKNEDVGVNGLELLREMGVCNPNPEKIRTLLNRPIRVCGMVMNTGEPGGGPFWIRNGDEVSLQIVETSQVNMGDPSQAEIIKSSTHFNPVDIVCGIKDYKGQKFDLLNFRDDNTGFISEKTYEGTPIRAMELPGLWNGSMADWNTIFVEVPLSTFNPVKTVADLLRPEHQPVED